MRRVARILLLIEGGLILVLLIAQVVVTLWYAVSNLFAGA